MSWGNHVITYEVWNQRVLTGITKAASDFGNTEEKARAIVDASGKVEFEGRRRSDCNDS